EYYRTKIFAPAGMTQTYAGNAPSNAPMATGYDPSASRQFTQADAGDTSWYYACGDVLSTATDLARFDIALMNGTLVKPSTLRTMIDSAQPSTLGKHVSYGLGIMTSDAGGSDRFVGHHGGMPGFEAEDEMFLPDRFAIISLGNAFTYPTNVLRMAAIAAVYPERAAELQAQAQADAAEAAASEDPVLTQRFTAFLTALLAGSIDKTQLSDPMAAAMTPNAVAQVQQLFSKEGTFQRLRFVSEDTAAGYRRYHYIGVFSAENQPLLFVLDPANKITGFFVQ
ncbi:MAG: beta-lactamase family protein, partial [Candidatus Eremiobacteraeota bacterium]|nr:beta-lactamase family protein [Candidatus Eremiobacteraeota bacterium]